MTDLTAAVLTRDEEHDLPGCLRSLKALSCPVLVIDSGSTDDTVTIAHSHGARVVEREFRGFADQRNAVLELLDTPWAFFVDADERVTSALADAVLNAIEHADDDIAAFQIPRRNYAFGRPLRGGGWWPDYQTRLLRLGRARFDEAIQVHEVVRLDGVAPALTHPLLHLNYRSRREFVTKQRHYTERRLALESPSHRPRARHIVGRAGREFLRRLCIDGGYRDGLDGLFMAGVLAAEEARYIWRLRRTVS